MIKFYIICQVITIPSIFGYFFYCPNTTFPGINANYEDISQKEFDFNANCNQDCHCSKYSFNPVCGSDGRTFLNPCFAGCLNSIASENFTDCACVNDDLKLATSDYCDLGCSGRMIGQMVTGLVLVFFTFASAMPSIVATLRSVEPVHRSLGVGIETIFTR